MDDCIFCKIVRGEIPVAKLIETDKALSFLDISPVNPGHSLVIPKRHAETLLDLAQDELHTCIFTVQRIARAVVKTTGAAGFNVLQNNDACAGQEIPHTHFHVIPRDPDDGFNLGWRQGHYSEGQLEELQDQIQSFL